MLLSTPTTFAHSKLPSLMIGSVSSFSHLKNCAGGVLEERFTEELGMDLNNLRNMNT